MKFIMGPNTMRPQWSCQQRQIIQKLLSQKSLNNLNYGVPPEIGVPLKDIP